MADGATLVALRVRFAVFTLDRGLDVRPEVVWRVDDGEQLACGFGNGFQVSQQGTAQLAILNVRMRAGVNSCSR